MAPVIVPPRSVVVANVSPVRLPTASSGGLLPSDGSVVAAIVPSSATASAMDPVSAIPDSASLSDTYVPQYVRTATRVASSARNPPVNPSGPVNVPDITGP